MALRASATFGQLDCGSVTRFPGIEHAKREHGDSVLMALHKIVSGEQSGVDGGALDAALTAEFPCGGWCPADRAAEYGPIPARYPLTPVARRGHRERTRRTY